MPNRLARETSPYLLQHADNPVDWYPWSEEAIAKARRENRPIFLSIGYSACHWCHVMEHESFENPQIAEYLNERFVSIKVDREERPDLDQIYMAAVQLISGRGGWPMSVFLTPGLRPFYGGTYWPPAARWGMPGFADVLRAVHENWLEQRTALESQAERLTAALQQALSASGADSDPRAAGAGLLREAARRLCRAADRTHGGFGRAPKFPHPIDLRVLLRAAHQEGDRDARDVAVLTLTRMARGGLYDQLGGGFHRYSTDERWLVPHFEKMLYDNALLVPAYADAWRLTRNPEFLHVVRETLDYVLREMTHPSGGFYSTQDADSEGVEGKYFVWTADEVQARLGEEDAAAFCAAFDVSAGGNWENVNILNRPQTLEETAGRLGKPADELRAVLERGKAALFAVRQRRPAPATDEKILASWNGLMLSAFAAGAEILGEPRYETAARRAAGFLRREMRRPDGSLWHTWKDGAARIPAFADDEINVLQGLLDLFELVQEPEPLAEAVQLAERFVARFHDLDGGGFFFTSGDHGTPLARFKELQDNATPSSNGVAACALARLAAWTGRRDFLQLAEETRGLLTPLMRDHPMAAAQALLAPTPPFQELVFVDGGDPQASQEAWAALSRRYHGARLRLRIRREDHWQGSPVQPALWSGKTAREPGGTVYLCENGVCQAPQSPRELLE